nr:MAG TPA: hypothetical protein [Caudoviricetes sp.]
MRDGMQEKAGGLSFLIAAIYRLLRLYFKFSRHESGSRQRGQHWQYRIKGLKLQAVFFGFRYFGRIILLL